MACGIHPGFHNFLLGLEAEGDVFRFTGIRETGVGVSAPAVLAVGTGVAEVLGNFFRTYHGNSFPQILTGGQRSGTHLGTFRVHQGQNQDVGFPLTGGVGLFDLAADIEKDPSKYAHACDGKKIATLFYEPSTRTRLSFEAAMMNLGGKALGFAGADQSSAAKGESVADTIRVVSCFADIAAIRHNKEGAAYVASQFSGIPVINAGDGGHEHPTQTLLDMMTIRQLKGRLDHFTIGICGDLKFGRTVHSLVKTMARYEGIHFVFISPPELKVPDYIIELLNEKGYTYEECIKLEDVITKLDLLYMTRVQRERFFNEEDYVRLKDFYVLTEKLLRRAKEDMYVLHPLPRVNEISVEVDKDPRAAYFKQVQYGVYVRMALILTLLDIHVD